MKYEIVINRKILKTDSKKAYDDLVESKEILRWMIDNSCDYKDAAVKFDYLERTLRLKLARAGHRAVVDWGKRRKIVERACQEHMKTGSIKNICKEDGTSKTKMIYRMQNSGYSLTTKQYSLHRHSNISLKSKVDMRSIAAKYEKILYNQILSYCEDFKMHSPFCLRG